VKGEQKSLNRMGRGKSTKIVGEGEWKGVTGNFRPTAGSWGCRNQNVIRGVICGVKKDHGRNVLEGRGDSQYFSENTVGSKKERDWGGISNWAAAPQESGKPTALRRIDGHLKRGRAEPHSASQKGRPGEIRATREVLGGAGKFRRKTVLRSGPQLPRQSRDQGKETAKLTAVAAKKGRRSLERGGLVLGDVVR